MRTQLQLDKLCAGPSTTRIRQCFGIRKQPHDLDGPYLLKIIHRCNGEGHAHVEMNYLLPHVNVLKSNYNIATNRRTNLWQAGVDRIADNLRRESGAERSLSATLRCETLIATGRNVQGKTELNTNSDK